MARQESAELTENERRQRKKNGLLKELNELIAFKSVWNTEAGRLVLVSIINESAPLRDVHRKNNGETSYALGEQKIGKMIIDKLLDAGCEVKLSDIKKEIKTLKIKQIESEINVLNKPI